MSNRSNGSFASSCRDHLWSVSGLCVSCQWHCHAGIIECQHTSELKLPFFLPENYDVPTSIHNSRKCIFVALAVNRLFMRIPMLPL